MGKQLTVSGAEITARDDALFFHALIGMNGVLKFGSQLDHEIVNVNKINIKDGMVQAQGRNYVIYPSDVESLTIENGTQNQKRYDLIVYEISKEDNQEILSLKVIKGTPDVSNPVDPILTQQDTLSSGTKFQLPLYRIRLNGINIEGVDDLRTFINNLNNAPQIVSVTDEYVEMEINVEE